MNKLMAIVDETFPPGYERVIGGFFMIEPMFRRLPVNGIQFRLAEMGEGPLVLLLHGFPESWYSWRHQLSVLAAAGYRVAVPDMRGYGKTTQPSQIEEYDMLHLTDDVVDLMGELGESRAFVVGHDWGAIVAWATAQRYPEKLFGVAGMSVPLFPRPSVPTTEVFKQQHGDDFFYALYFQEPGVAEVELDADPEGIISRILAMGAVPCDDPEITDPKASAGGFIKRLGQPQRLPAWLHQEDLDYYVSEFKQSGFVGGINYYRNMDRNWELMADYYHEPTQVPACFIGGEKDPVIQGADAASLRHFMSTTLGDLRVCEVLPKVGHWIQQEAPERTNQILLDFFASCNAK